METAIGSRLLMDGVIAVVKMETSTSLLLRVNNVDQWVPRSSPRLSQLPGGEASDTPGTAVPPPAPLGEPMQDEAEDDECFYCGNGGKLTCCDVCPHVYHIRCLPAADSARLRRPDSAGADWWCPRCRRLVRLAFSMSRELAHPAVGEPGAAADVAQRLFEFMSDPHHDGQWEALREAGVGLLNAMPLIHPWQQTARDDSDVAALADVHSADHAALLALMPSAQRIEPGLWAECLADDDMEVVPAGGSGSGGGGVGFGVGGVGGGSGGSVGGVGGVGGVGVGVGGVGGGGGGAAMRGSSSGGTSRGGGGGGGGSGSRGGGSSTGGGGSGRSGGGGGSSSGGVAANGGGSSNGGAEAGDERGASAGEADTKPPRTSEFRGVSRRYGRWKVCSSLCFLCDCRGWPASPAAMHSGYTYTYAVACPRCSCEIASHACTAPPALLPLTLVEAPPHPGAPWCLLRVATGGAPPSPSALCGARPVALGVPRAASVLTRHPRPHHRHASSRTALTSSSATSRTS